MFELLKQRNVEEKEALGSSFGDLNTKLKEFEAVAPKADHIMKDLDASIKRAEQIEKNIRAANIAYAAASTTKEEPKETSVKSPCGCFGG